MRLSDIQQAVDAHIGDQPNPQVPDNWKQILLLPHPVVARTGPIPHQARNADNTMAEQAFELDTVAPVAYNTQHDNIYWYAQSELAALVCTRSQNKHALHTFLAAARQLELPYLAVTSSATAPNTLKESTHWDVFVLFGDESFVRFESNELQYLRNADRHTAQNDIDLPFNVLEDIQRGDIFVVDSHRVDDTDLLDHDISEDEHLNIHDINNIWLEANDPIFDESACPDEPFSGDVPSMQQMSDFLLAALGTSNCAIECTIQSDEDEDGGISDIYDDNAQIDTNLFIELFHILCPAATTATGHEWEYNDGHRTRQSGYSKNAITITIHSDNTQLSAHTIMEHRKNMLELLATNPVLQEKKTDILNAMQHDA